METYRHAIVVSCELEHRVVYLENSCVDEAISAGIIYFDKYAQKPGDSVIVGRVETEISDNQVIHTVKGKRIITLGRNLNVEITVL